MTVPNIIRILSVSALLLIGSGSVGSAGTMPSGWQETWRSFGVDPRMAEAIVWPEYKLYDRFKDLMETTAVYGSSYVSGGLLDMSIGLFQMKPSFVESIEKAWQGSGMDAPCTLEFDTSGSSASDRERISRMMRQEWQVIYLGMFLRLLYHSYGSFDTYGNRIRDGIETLPIQEQVQLAANAYNRGCTWFEAGGGDPDILRVNIDKETFPRIIVPLAGRRQYSYAALAWEHFRSLSEEEPPS